jgi:hypothetical protein
VRNKRCLIQDSRGGKAGEVGSTVISYEMNFEDSVTNKHGYDSADYIEIPSFPARVKWGISS